MDGWQRLCAPDRLAAAVLEANDDAVRRAVSAWASTLADGRLAGRTDGFGREAVMAAPGGEAAESTELAERVLASLQQVQRLRPSEAAVWTGIDDGRHVTVELGATGLTGCIIDVRWAARHHGVTITEATSTALRRVTTQRCTALVHGAELDSLLGDALATLTAVCRQPTTGGEI
jgi:hypothetical protein